MQQSLAPSTLQIYQRGISLFIEFRQKFGLSNLWPAPVNDILNFMVFLVQDNFSHSSISCYLTGISFFCKINGFVDSTQGFIVRKMLEGIKRSKDKQKDQRLPITIDLLRTIFGVLPSVCKSRYELLLFKAAFSLAFFGLLRISEVATSNGNGRHIISVSDVSFGDGMLKVNIPSSKTDQLGRGSSFVIQAQSDRTLCPHSHINSYLTVRPPIPGPLFCHFNGSPLTRYQLVSVLKKSLNLAGIDHKGFSSHSFRIGGATSLALAGFSDDLIMQAGRWRSFAYKTYIRA